MTDLPRGPIPDSYWIEPGRLLAGAYPGAVEEAAGVQRVALFRDAGIDFFLDLTEEGELRRYLDDIEPLEHRRMSIRDFTCPTSDHMRAILDALDDALERGRRVYVHCWGGIGRTGTVIGCWLVRHGRSAEQALDLIAGRRRETPNAWRRSPETDEQRAFVEQWRERDPARGTASPSPLDHGSSSAPSSQISGSSSSSSASRAPCSRSSCTSAGGSSTGRI